MAFDALYIRDPKICLPKKKLEFIVVLKKFDVKTPQVFVSVVLSLGLVTGLS